MANPKPEVAVKSCIPYVHQGASPEAVGDDAIAWIRETFHLNFKKVFDEEADIWESDKRAVYRAAATLGALGALYMVQAKATEVSRTHLAEALKIVSQECLTLLADVRPARPMRKYC